MAKHVVIDFVERNAQIDGKPIVLLPYQINLIKSMWSQDGKSLLKPYWMAFGMKKVAKTYTAGMLIYYYLTFFSNKTAIAVASSESPG